MNAIGRTRSSIRLCLMAVATLTAIVLTVPALALADLSRPIQFDIPAQHLETALLRFAEQAGIEITAASEIVAAKESPSLRGLLPAGEALRKLLCESGLTYSVLDGRTIAIRRLTPGAFSKMLFAGNQPSVLFASNQPALLPSAQGTTATVPASSQSASPPNDSLEEVVVTANRRAELLQNVPMAVSAVTGETLHELNAQDFTDYARTIPGVSFRDEGDGREQVTIRGISATTRTPTVAYYIGDTPMPPAVGNLARTQANPTLIDIDRIEVLRGPQGTLYGAMSESGTIRLIPKAPDLHDLTGFVEGGGDWTQGDSWAGKASGAINLPVIEDLFAVRGAAWYRANQGFIEKLWGPDATASPPQYEGSKNNTPDQHASGFRLSALYTPSNIASVSAMIYNETYHASGMEDITGGTVNPSDALKQIFLADVPEPYSSYFTLFDVTGKLTSNDFSLTSSTSYYNGGLSVAEEGTAFIQSYFGNAVAGPYAGLPYPNALSEVTHYRSFTQELRLATVHPFVGFSAIAGVYYDNIDADATQSWPFPSWNASFAPGGPTDPNYAPGNLVYALGGPNGGPAQHKYGELSQFGEISYALTPTLTLTGGVRHYDIHNSDDEVVSGFINGGTTNNNTSGQFNGNVYKGNLSYQITPDHLIYAQYSEGFRPGFGVVPLPSICNSSLAAIGINSSPSQVNPDNAKNYEFGAKTSWLERRVTVNAAIYRIRWQDVEEALQLPCGYTFDANAGSATSDGVELEAEAKLSASIAIGASGSYNKATLDQNEPDFGAFKGDQLLNVPLWQYAAHLTYLFPMGPAARGSARLEVQHTGDSYADYSRLAGTTARDPASLLGPLTLVGARLGFIREGWDVGLVGNNLFDELARQDRQISIIADVAGRPRYVINRPRSIGLDIKKSF